MSFRAQITRINYIDQRLRNMKDYPSSNQLLQGLLDATGETVCKRTMQRDITWMRDEGAPIEYDSRNRGYYYSHENWQMPAISMTEGDLLALLVADRALSGYRNSPYYDKLKQVFERLTHLLPEKVTVASEDLAAGVSVVSDPVTRIYPEIWDLIREGMDSRKSVGIQYQSPGYSEAVERTIDPLHIVGHRGEWYVLGWCHRKEQVRIYAFARIKYCKVTGKSFQPPEGFKAENYIDPNIGIFVSEESVDMLIRFKNEAAVKIQERRWHPDQQITKNPDGSITLSFNTNQQSQILFWVSQWGPDAEILKPEGLRQRAKERFEAMAALYR